MASIIKRKNTYSVVYYYINEDGVKKQKWETCKNLSEAKQRKTEIENQKLQGNFIPPYELTIREFLKDFVKIYGTAHWALSTYQSNTSLIENYINPTIGNELVQNITPKYVDEYYIRLQKVKSVTNRNRLPKNEYLMTAQQHAKVSRLLFGINISINSCCLYLEKTIL